VSDIESDYSLFKKTGNKKKKPPKVQVSDLYAFVQVQLKPGGHWERFKPVLLIQSYCGSDSYTDATTSSCLCQRIGTVFGPIDDPQWCLVQEILRLLLWQLLWRTDTVTVAVETAVATPTLTAAL